MISHDRRRGGAETMPGEDLVLSIRRLLRELKRWPKVQKPNNLVVGCYLLLCMETFGGFEPTARKFYEMF